MEILISFFKREGFKRFLIVFLVSVVLYLIRDRLSIFLLTFIFAYVMYNIQNFVMSKTEKHIKLKSWIVITAIYLLLVTSVVLIVSVYIPIVITESKGIFHQVKTFYDKPHDNVVENYLISLIKEKDLQNYFQKGMNIFYLFMRNVSRICFNVAMAIVLSFFFLLEKDRISNFVKKLKSSKIATIYNEIEHFGTKFAHSFGMMIQVRIIISLVNSVLAAAGLFFLGFSHIAGLALLIFITGLIPIIGAFIWLIPVCLIGFIKGGIYYVIYIVVMAIVLHVLESYVLSPRLMSSGTELPLFIILIILMLGEHFLGVWGLFIGIPIFLFGLNLLDVSVEVEKDKKEEGSGPEGRIKQ